MRIRVRHARGRRIVILNQGGGSIVPDDDDRLRSDDETVISPLIQLEGKRRMWWRVEVRGPDGKLWLLGNPIYVETTP